MRVAICILAVAVSTAALATTSIALVPENMNIQGVLTDGLGNPVPAGLKNFTFKIFDQEVGGAEIWPAGPGELQTLVTDADGLWKAAVGTFVPLTTAVFQDSSRWLEVTVDNGIDPAETLPRIKLNTVPYSFNAGAVGGSTPGDLTDQFVDVPGDTMTGRLVLEVPWKDLPGSSFRVKNISDANTASGVAGNTIAVLGEAKSDGAEGKYALVGYADGSTGSTVAVYGRGEGSGGFNVGVYGDVIPNGTLNYSGYFWGGDVRVGSPATPGDAAVQLPDNSIGDQEILNEPGIAQSVLGSGLSLTASGTSQNILAITITIPDDGYIVLNGQTYLTHSGDNAAFGWVQLSEVSNESQGQPSFVWTGRYEAAGFGGYDYQTIATRRIFFKSAGVHTFYLQGNAYAFNDAGSSVIVLAGSTTLLATYFPSSIGTVSTVSAVPGHTPGQAGASSVHGPGETQAQAEIVDLRALELELVKAEAETEKARSALLEAQLRQGPKVDGASAAVVE